MTKMFGQNFPRPIPKKPKPQNPEFNSIPIPPPKRWIPPPFWGGNPLLWGGESDSPPRLGGNRYGVELWILRIGFFRDRSRKMLTKKFRHLKSFKKQVFEISIFEIDFLHITVWLPNVNSWNLLHAQTPTLATVLNQTLTSNLAL